MGQSEDQSACSGALLLIAAPFFGVLLGGGLGGALGILGLLETAGEAMLPPWVPTVVLVFGLAVIVAGGVRTIATGRPQTIILWIVLALTPKVAIAMLGMTAYAG